MTAEVSSLIEKTYRAQKIKPFSLGYKQKFLRDKMLSVNRLKTVKPLSKTFPKAIERTSSLIFTPTRDKVWRNHVLKMKTLVMTGLVCLITLTANAQIGTGWTPYSPSFVLQIRGCGASSGLNFSITCAATSGDNRAERRYANLTAAMSQFQGTVVVTSLTGDRINLKQTFQDNIGPWNMIAVKKPGALYEVSTGATLASYTIGTAVRINTITDTVKHTTQVYINGSLVETKTGGKGSLYDKFGTYRTHSGKGPVSATWSNIQFWKK